MTIPKDIGRPPNENDGECLYHLPEEFRDSCEAAVAAGHARSAAEYWYYEQRTKGPNFSFVRSLLTAIVGAAIKDRSDTRNETQRIDDAMKALFGRMAVTGSNEIDDAQLVQEMAWQVEITGADHSALRRIARVILKDKNLGASTIESAGRRLVGKFAADPAEAAAAARGCDPMPGMLEAMVLRKVCSLLHSVGVPTNK